MFVIIQISKYIKHVKTKFVIFYFFTIHLSIDDWGSNSEICADSRRMSMQSFKCWFLRRCLVFQVFNSFIWRRSLWQHLVVNSELDRLCWRHLTLHIQRSSWIHLLSSNHATFQKTWLIFFSSRSIWIME